MRFNVRASALKVAAAALSALVAAGFVDLAAALRAFAAPDASGEAAAALAAQLRWGAGVVAVFLGLRATGVFRLGCRRRLATYFTRGTDGHWALGVFVLAFAARVIYAGFAAPPPVSDEGCYVALARGLAAGTGYGAAGEPSAYWPVGYAAALAPFVATFGLRYWPLIIFQATLGALTAAFLVYLGKAFGKDAWARGAAVLVALWPSQVAYAARLFPAVLSAFLVVAAALLIVRYRGYWAAAAGGALSGLAGLALPAALFLPVGFVAVDLFARRGIARAAGRLAIAAAVAAAVVAPWTYRNWRAFGAFIPISTNGGVNLWIGNNPHASGAYYYPTSSINPLYITEGELARDRLGRTLAFHFIKTERERFLLLTVPRLAYLYGADISAFQLEAFARGIPTADAARTWPARLAQGYYALTAAAFLLALFKARKKIFRAPPPTFPLAALLTWPVYFIAVYLVFFGQDRFHFPVVPFVALIATRAFFVDKE